MKIVRWRYIKVELLNNVDVDEEELIHLIWRRIYELFGIIEGSKFGFKLLQWNKDMGEGIIRVSWKYLDKMRVVLGTLYKDNKPILLNDILVSGTQASLKRKLLKRVRWRDTLKKILDVKKKYLNIGVENGGEIRNNS